jgi:hypothetical protein
MDTYHFTYTNASGGMIRLTAMQCGSDASALIKARQTMKDKYAGLFIVAGERAVCSFMPF